MISELCDALKERRVMLFVGAGASVSLGLPTWRGLVEHVAEELGFDPDVFLSSGDYLSLMEFYKIKTGSIGPLRSWMDREWTSSDADILASSIHKSIAELDFPLIYTTNYDRNIETALRLHGKSYQRVANEKELIQALGAHTQVIKFHGDFEHDESLVVTESDYYKRLEFESAFDIKLRSDALSYSMLFIGYSLSDINMRILLYKMAKLWGSTGYADKKPKSYIFMTHPNEVQEAVLESWGVQAIKEDTDNPNDALPKFLDRLRAAMTTV